MLSLAAGHLARQMRPLALVLLLFLTQAALASHQVDVAKHAAGEQCEWCVAGVHFAAAVPSSGLALSVLPYAPVPLQEVPAMVSVGAIVYASRAPPFSPSV